MLNSVDRNLPDFFLDRRGRIQENPVNRQRQSSDAWIVDFGVSRNGVQAVAG